MLSKEILELLQRAIGEQDVGAGQHTLQFSERSVPFATPLGVQTRDAARSAPVVVASVQQRAPGDPAEMPEGGEGEAGDMEGPTSEMTTFRMSGTASSTSVDWYGTEMSKPCLDDMAAQFTHGVEVFVGHGSWTNPLEWDKAIGITDGAEVKSATVMDPADPKERGAVLTVEMAFAYNDETPADLRDAIKLLRQRVQRGLPTGLSIGGWFRQVTYITGEDGELLRIIIDKVDLDHLATTRRPANPDCLDMALMRSVLAGVLKARAMPTAEPVVLAAEPAPTVPADPTPAKREIDPKNPRLADSEYEQPPHGYVEDIKSDYPDIWDEGGNIRGNDAYRYWTMYREGDRSESVLDWVVEREGWAARHFDDFQLAGVMAQLKWGVVGSKGYDHQKQVIEEAKAKADEADAEESSGEVEVSQEPAPTRSPDSDNSVPTSDTELRAEPPLATNPELPASREEEIDMTPEQIQALLADGIARALAAAGVGTAPTAPADSTPAQRELDDANQRRGQHQTPTPVVLQAPAGADIARARSLVDGVILRNRSGHSPDSIVAEFKGEILRAFHFGEDNVPHARAISYREPSGQRQKAMWLGVAHQIRGMGVTGVADVVERSAEVLGLEIRGIRGLRTEATADKERVDTDARALIADAVRAAVAEGHPTFKEPGTREAATRALTVSGASDKVTTALISALLQQLSNVQLGARTQLRRIPGTGTAYQTPKRTVSSTLAEFIADGSAPTEDSGTWNYDTWGYKTLATRVKVTRRAQAQGAQWGDLVSSEMLYKAEDFNRQEEVAIFQGDSANSLPTANAFNGLITLIGANSGQTVANTTANAGDVISLVKLDETIDKVRGRENKGNLRIFASEKGHRLLNTVLQADQAFNNVVMVQAGFVVQTYQGIPVLQSSGVPDACTYNGATPKVTAVSGGATTAIVVVNLTHVYMVVLTPVTMSEVAVTTAQYTEWEMYCDETLVLDNSYGAAMLAGIKAS